MSHDEPPNKENKQQLHNLWIRVCLLCFTVLLLCRLCTHTHMYIHTYACTHACVCVSVNKDMLTVVAICLETYSNQASEKNVL